jgi:hypothetical protein
MKDITYVGLDVHKATICVAIAESGRGGELREVGVFENRPEVLRKIPSPLEKGSGRRDSDCFPFVVYRATPSNAGPAVDTAVAAVSALRLLWAWTPDTRST